MDRLAISPIVGRALDVAETHLGMAELSDLLQAPAPLIRTWQRGHSQMPQKDFLRLVDILVEIAPNWAD